MGNSWLPERRVYLSRLQPCLLFLTVDRAHYGHHSECLSTCILPFTGPLNCATGMYQRSENFRCKENFMVCINHEKTNKQTNKQTNIFYNVLQRLIITVSTFLYTWFHSIDTCIVFFCFFFRMKQPLCWYPQVTRSKCTTTFSVSDRSSVFTATVRAYGNSRFLWHTSSSPTPTW